MIGISIAVAIHPKKQVIGWGYLVAHGPQRISSPGVVPAPWELKKVFKYGDPKRVVPLPLFINITPEQIREFSPRSHSGIESCLVVPRIATASAPWSNFRQLSSYILMGSKVPKVMDPTRVLVPGLASSICYLRPTIASPTGRFNSLRSNRVEPYGSPEKQSSSAYELCN